MGMQDESSEVLSRLATLERQARRGRRMHVIVFCVAREERRERGDIA